MKSKLSIMLAAKRNEKQLTKKKNKLLNLWELHPCIMLVLKIIT